MNSSIEAVIWANIVPDDTGQLMAISDEGRKNITAAVRAAVDAKDLRACAEGLALVGFLATQDHAAQAVEALRSIAKEFEAETTPMFIKAESAGSKANAAQKQRRQKILGNETDTNKAEVFGAESPEGTVKQRDLAPPRDPRFMR